MQRTRLFLEGVMMVASKLVRLLALNTFPFWVKLRQRVQVRARVATATMDSRSSIR